MWVIEDHCRPDGLTWCLIMHGDENGWRFRIDLPERMILT
jgi:hypothetical protein